MTNSDQTIQLNHHQLWELVIDNAQQHLLMTEEDESVHPLILATALYANLYLEQNLHGDLDQKGRFYWAAFSVFSHLNLLRYVMSQPVESSDITIKKTDFLNWQSLSDEQIAQKWSDPAVVKQLNQLLTEDLQQYALWQAIDQLSTHYYFQLDEASLTHQHNKNEIIQQPEKAAIHLSLSDINGFESVREALLKCNQHPGLYHAFDFIKNFNTQSEFEKNERLFNHLLALSEHLQLHFSQSVLYKDNDLLSALLSINNSIRQITQKKDSSLLPFSDSAIEVNTFYGFNDEELHNPNPVTLPAPYTIRHYGYRMKNIKEEAEKFHYLMQMCPEMMAHQISKIAAWISFDHQKNGEDEA